MVGCDAGETCRVGRGRGHLQLQLAGLGRSPTFQYCLELCLTLGGNGLLGAVMFLGQESME